MSNRFPAKRRKLNTERSISPPLIDQKGLGNGKHVTILPTTHAYKEAHLPIPPARSGPPRPIISNYVRSPVRLTKIKDLAPHQNVDTVELRELLGDPLIEECWCFNFLFDVPFIMQHFDPDIRQHVKLKIIHGFWKNDDERRIDLLESTSHYPNIDLISAYLPDPFGTHHTKMLILFRRDDAAQVIIHTANMIARDWRNMTQAVWESPLLPLQQAEEKPPQSTHPLGSGERFKTDLMRYLGAYGKRLGALMERLESYDFSSIRAAFLGSAPSKQKPHLSKPALYTSFGWLGLREILSQVPVRTDDDGGNKEKPNIVIQISSIATLGQTPTWLQHFQDVLSACRSGDDRRKDPSFNIIFPTPDEIRTSLDGYSSGGSIHTKIQSPAQQKQLDYLRPLLCHWRQPSPPACSNNLPSAHRGPAAPHIKTYIRFSDQTGQNIDWAMVSSANLSKQAWGDVVSNKTGEIRIQSWECGVVVWPELFKGEEEEEVVDVMMVPVFGKDEPGTDDEDGEGKGKADQRVPEEDADETESESEAETETASRDRSTGRQPNTNHGDETETETEDEDEDETETEDENENEDRGEDQESESESDHKAKDKKAGGRKEKRIVGFRMPYDLPLAPYRADEVPWCASLPHSEPDWMGRTWQGY